jgi:hypothetical protein
MSETEVSEDYDQEIQPAKKKKGAFGALLGYMPMFLLSITLHLFLLFIISLIPAESSQEVEEKTIITIFEEEKEEVKEPEEIVKIELEVKEVMVDPVDTTVAPTEEKIVEVAETPEVETDALDELMELLPDSNNNSEVPNLAVMGLTGGASGGSGLPSGYSNRSGKAKGKAVRKGGGDEKTESAVEAALEWLALHQEPDGSWDAKKYEGDVTDKGSITAGALLPFLGAGHNEVSGKYRKTVRDGVNYLNGLMSDPKVFNRPHFHNNYGSALALMALAESSIFGSSPTTKKNADRIAEYFVEQYTKNPEPGGWGYNSSGDDLSVSGWVALGLKSAKAADLPTMHTPESKQVFNKYKTWVDKVMTLPETGLGFYRPAGAVHGGIGSQHMGWVGMFNKQFLGFPLSDPFLRKASEVSIVIVNKKRWIGGDAPGDVYGIYYGTLSAFQQQGPMWDAWNPAMKFTLVNSQKIGNPKDLGGSWDPTKGHTAEKSGRVLTTALMALCLEVYYRYDMMH